MSRNGNGVGTLSLLRAAFGPSSTPYTVLQCDHSSTPAELRRAYHAAALQYHPDRLLLGGRHDNNNNNNGSEGEASLCTLKFQAVSAAYQVLMDEGCRARYDRTGEVPEDDNNQDGPIPPGNDQRWENFFRSMFDIRTGARHTTSAKEYRGSESERSDVLRYYNTCGGDMNKVAMCVPYGKDEDIGRWMRDIVDPAAAAAGTTGWGMDEKGTNGMACAMGSSPPSASKQWRRRVLEDSSSSDEEGDDRGDIAYTNEKVKGKIGKEKMGNHLLIDLNEEDKEDVKDFAKGSVMSKRDKMDYRSARVRKEMAEKEMGNHSWSQPSKKNAGGISDQLLSNLEEKYGGGNRAKKKKKM